MWMVLKKTSHNLSKGHWAYIALKDRNKDRDHWWTIKAADAFLFCNKKAAISKANSLKYGDFKVIDAKDFSNYVGHEFNYSLKSKSITLNCLLAARERLWHDDDWEENSD